MQMQMIVTVTRPSTDVAWGIPSTDELNNPWKLLGFSEKPNWWDGHYGATYNQECACWSDIKVGKIAQGDRAGTHSELAMPMVLKFKQDQELLDDDSMEVVEEGHDGLVWKSTHKFNTYDNFITYRDSWSEEDVAALDSILNSKNITYTVEEEYL